MAEKHRFAAGDTVYIWWNDAPVDEYTIVELVTKGRRVGYKLDNGYLIGDERCHATEAEATQ